MLRVHDYTGIALALLLLFALPAWAQDETLEPNATVAETNSDCTTANAHTRNSDNSDATLCDGGDGATSDAESYTLRFDFGSPAADVDTSTDAQAFQCRVQKSSSGGSDPTFTMDLWCNGVEKVVGATNTVTSATPVEFSDSFTYTTDADCDAAGDNVQLEVDVTRTAGSPSTRKSVDSIDCDWDVTHVAGGAERRIFLVD